MRKAAKPTVESDLDANTWWARPKRPIPHCDFHFDHRESDYKGYKAEILYYVGRARVKTLDPQSILLEFNGDVVGWKPKAVSPEWFVPLFGKWDGVRDGLLVALAAYGSLSVPAIAELLGVDGPPYKSLYRYIDHYERAGIIATVEREGHEPQRAFVQLDSRAPWYGPLSALLIARAPHFLGRWKTPTNALAPAELGDGFAFDVEALGKAFKSERAATMLYVIAAARPNISTARIAKLSGLSRAAITLAVDEGVHDGVLWTSVGRWRARTCRTAHALQYAQELSEMLVAFAEALGIRKFGTPASTEFRDHIRGKQIDPYLTRLRKGKYSSEQSAQEAADFSLSPPDFYTALVRTDERDAMSLHTFSGAAIDSASVVLISRERNNNIDFYGHHYNLEIADSISGSRYKAIAYPMNSQWMYAHITHL